MDFRFPPRAETPRRAGRRSVAGRESLEGEDAMMERQEINDARPARWVPVLDAVEAVIDRIVRESARRQERGFEAADAARA